jgi:hypothetical protein
LPIRNQIRSRYSFFMTTLPSQIGRNSACTTTRGLMGGRLNSSTDGLPIPFAVGLAWHPSRQGNPARLTRTALPQTPPTAPVIMSPSQNALAESRGARPCARSC